jgi:hypothetical protein
MPSMPPQAGISNGPASAPSREQRKPSKPSICVCTVKGWGHSVLKRLEGRANHVSISEDLLDAARALDKHYIPTRYPNGFDQGFPGDYYTKKEAGEAIEHARQVIGFCEGLLRG